MKLLALTQGKYAIVDDDIFNYLNQWKWNVSPNGYARRMQHVSGSKKNRVQRAIYLHRFIMNTPESMETDHINGNKLDNRRENLRICTSTQNHQNRGKNKRNTSGYKGVFWEKRAKKWVTYIRIDGLQKYVGLFDSKEEAAKAYDLAAIKYHGEFANINYN